jgi:hypothetical protein
MLKGLNLSSLVLRAIHTAPNDVVVETIFAYYLKLLARNQVVYPLVVVLKMMTLLLIKEL